MARFLSFYNAPTCSKITEPWTSFLNKDDHFLPAPIGISTKLY